MRFLKTLFKFAFLFFILAGSVLLLWISDHYTVPIMMYHNVEDIDHHEANWVSPKNFERHMRYLKENGYEVISLNDFVEMSRVGKEFPRKTVVITFDDGYKNNYLNAFPVLTKYKLSATIFIPPNRIGSKKEYLNWDELKLMSNSGVFNVGSHGMDGEYLPDMSDEEQQYQILKSKSVLEEKLGEQIDYFAYPIGGFSDQIKQFVQSAGYRGAVTTNRGYDKFNKDLFELNRIRFSNKDNSNIILWVKLSGYYNILRELKNPY